MNRTIPEISRKECFDRLAAGAVLVTVNRRLSRSLAFRYADFRMKRGDAAWQTPDILPYGAWLTRLFYDPLYFRNNPDAPGINRPELLDEVQERLVWERIISDSDAAAGLIDVYEAARMVQEAWRLCRQWQVPIGGDVAWSAPDPAAFAGWAEAFDRFCGQSGFLDRARLEEYLCAEAAAGRITGVCELILAGFDEWSPAQTDLFSALGAAGTRVCRMAQPVRAAAARRVVAPDDAGEIRAAARWARKRVEADPETRIAVVSPRLAAERDAVCREFEDALCPPAILSAQPPEKQMFNITAAPPLSAYPLPAAAMRILDVAGQHGAEVFDWSRLLRSPFLAGAETELGARAALDIQLREHGDLFFSVAAVLKMVRAGRSKQYSASDLRIFAGILEKLQETARQAPARQLPEKWAQSFSALLEAAGWPGQRPLSSHEYQTTAAWHQVLETMGRIGVVSGAVSRREARRMLSRMLAETPFQPEQPDVPVQIMGMLETAGEEFDALWIMGMHHEIWPAPARPNPFVPVPVQRKKGLPHSSPARELAYARQITGRLICCADEVVCSFGAGDGESTRLPSPLIDHLPSGDPDGVEANPAPGYWHRIHHSAGLEVLCDIRGAGVAAGEDVAGGTGIIKSQALCPFQAYARYRLSACGPQSPEPGLNARDRGILVHRALELLWRQIGDHAALVRMKPQTLALMIRQVVQNALGRMAAGRAGTFTERFVRVETDRLENLISEWMEQERGRAPFSVKDTESRMHVRIGDIGIYAIADRIDTLDSGRQVLIDYKTGDPKPSDWFAERIAEPQLPLYTLGLGREAEVAGVLFARVKKGGAAYLGIADAGGIAPGIRPVIDDGKIAGDFESLREVVTHWEQKLFALAEEIRSGHAAVDPVSENRACRYCDLSQLCRIWEVTEP